MESCVNLCFQGEEDSIAYGGAVWSDIRVQHSAEDEGRRQRH